MRALLACLCFSAAMALAASTATAAAGQGFNVFAGYGMNFTFPGTIRAGSGGWEGGLLSPGFLGAVKNFSIGPRTYSGFGLGFNADGAPSSVGFQAATGFNYELFWKIGLRGELMARAVLNGTTLAHGLLGVSYGF